MCVGLGSRFCPLQVIGAKLSASDSISRVVAWIIADIIVWKGEPKWGADTRVSALHSNPNLRHVDLNPLEECLGEPGPIYFGEGLDEDSQVPEIEESLHRLEDRQLTSVEPTEEINVGTEDEPRTLKIGTGLDPTQQARMIDFLTRYQEVFAWS
ncbi:hypothetical protein CDL15_Pgr007990 [Punica granatum]|uniref:Uncharacterized protein n=1 Tax=Punica granatum TaxID=22663 RepID=A0A218XML9_PUNGR|nr:hypothetical protein CDL15_Pgr007990 [Punica granatum]